MSRPDFPDGFPDVGSLHGRRATARWERTVVGDLLERVCWSYPDKEAIVGDAAACSAPEFRRLTYRQADRLANRVANALLALGLERGDRVMFLCENSVEAYVAKIGVAKAGLVSAPVNPRLGADMQCNLVERLTPRFAFFDAEFEPAIAALFDGTDMPVVAIPVGRAASSSRQDFATFVSESSDMEPDVEIHGDDIWQILPTSGTTSMPKLVMQSHLYGYFAAYTSAMTYTRGLRFEADLRMYCPFPAIYHASDQAHTFPAFLAGGTLLLARRNDPEDNARFVTEERATAMFGGSSGFLKAFATHVAANRDRFDISSLTSITYTWAPIHPEIADMFKSLCGGGVMITGHLGQTEVLSTTRFWPDRWPETYRAEALKKNHVGVPNPLLATAIRTDDGRIIGPDTPGVTGEIVYRTPSVTAGYYHDADATRRAFEGGWFASGDCGQYDPNGLLVLIDRYKDMIKTGGENVSTIRVEAVLNAHPAIRKSAVVGLPHPRWSEAVTAFVIAEAGASCEEAEIVAYCRKHLAGFETPKAVIIVDTLPETVGGKVQKQVLRDLHAHVFDPKKRTGTAP
ncbi:MAG: class I adenylate-forming enzyme family protein [Rhizobiaceae bacterium]